MPPLTLGKEEEVIQLVRDFGDTLQGVRSILDSVERYRQCFRGDHCELPLNNGMVALIDLCDYWHLTNFLFYAVEDRFTFYARCNVGNNKKKYMHTLIMNPAPGMVVDHINHNGLDNRRSNLRVVSIKINNLNKRPQTTKNKTGFVGVRRLGRKKPPYEVYVGVVQHNGKTYGTQHLPTPEAAARAYDRLAREFHGEFAVLNFPNE